MLRDKIVGFINYIYKAKNIFNKIERNKPIFKLIEINKTNDDEYIATIQVINKTLIFKSKPEELLADDNLVNRFSPKDVRTLTYLGYLEMNSPKYKILAKRLLEGSDKILFALKKKGENNLITKTASEIIKEKDIINNLTSIDAQLIGYTVATESIFSEDEEKRKLLAKIK